MFFYRNSMTTTKSARPPKVAIAPSPAAPKPRPSTKAAKAPAESRAAVASTAPTNVKNKLIRDSFTIPKSEYVVLDELKQRATLLMRPAKKSELLRAGIKSLAAMSDKAFLLALAGVPNLQTGRPRGDQTE
jgi:hypothetical protein